MNKTLGKVVSIISNLVLVRIEGDVFQNEICFIHLGEEKLMAEEGLQKTDNDLIHIGNPIKFDEDVFLDKLEGLMMAAYANREGQIRGLVKDMVTTYYPEGHQVATQRKGA